MKKILLLASLIMLLIPENARTQTPSYCIVSGQVMDDVEPLVGATLKFRKDTVTLSAQTDIDGKYSIRLPEGEYAVEATYTGYEPERLTFKTEGQAKRILDFRLKAGESTLEIVELYLPLMKQDQTSSGQMQTINQTNVSARRGKPSKKESPKVQAVMSKPAPSTSVYAPREAPGRRYENGIRRDSMEPISREQYNQIVENPYQKTAEAPVSTFSIDVDAASYSNVRRILNQGGIPPTDAVRIEEMINYFDYQYPEPANEHPIEVITELSPCPWNNEHHLLMIGLQGRRMDLGQLPPSNLVFLLDVSGSMNEENKLPLVKQSMHLLIDQLRPEDRVAIVVYAGAAGLVLESTPASDKAKIEAALDRLSAGGSTAGGAGIQLAYQTARANMKPGGNNRVVLCTDGDFNVGISNQADLVKLIETERESGVYLSVLGFGTGNYQDGTMQMLADKGNGNHAYIDQISEANKVLVKEFGGTLFAIAKDVKLQLDFNPDQVAEYRLIGYENRMLAKEDFDDDTKDAGELGAGHTVTALYEIVPAKSKPAQKAHSDRLMTLKFRYKKPTGNQASRLIEKEISAVCAVKPSDNMQLATAVAEFGLLLRDSKYKGNATFEHALNLARSSAKAKDPDGYRAELATLIEQAKTRSGK